MRSNGVKCGEVANGGEHLMFVGNFEYRVDEKGRVPIPPKFRSEELKQDGVILCPGIEKCVTIYPLSEWKKFADSLTPSPILDSRSRKLGRGIGANSFAADLDGQGRIMIPAKLRQHAGIGEEVVVIGANRYMELWSKESWDTEYSTGLAEAFNILKSLEQH